MVEERLRCQALAFTTNQKTQYPSSTGEAIDFRKGLKNMVTMVPCGSKDVPEWKTQLRFDVGKISDGRKISFSTFAISSSVYSVASETIDFLKGHKNRWYNENCAYDQPLNVRVRIESKK